MSTKHTPGPWAASAGGYAGWEFEGGYNGQIVAVDGTVIYRGPASFRSLRARTEEEATANARLIAAAPTLLAACRLASRRFSDLNGEVSPKVWNENYPAVKAIADAIALAEGES